jgi:hypothetical protein
MTDGYDKADYYDASGNPEALSHSSPEEAIEHMLNSWAEPGCDMRKVIAEYGACTVVAYARRRVEDSELEHRARWLAENFAENFDDDHGSPDGDETFPDAVLKTLAEGITKLLRQAVDEVDVWACEECGAREYSSEETETLMREHCPEWFEENE